MSFLDRKVIEWKAKHTYRQKKLNYYVARGDEIGIDKWEALRDEASKRLRFWRGRVVLKREYLSPNFNVSEFDCHDGTKVPEEAHGGLKDLCDDVLEPLRRQFGAVTINSAYRHRSYNARIGGAKYSEHIYDLSPRSVAADVRFARGTPAQWAAAARRLGIGGVGQYDRAGFIHVDNGPRRDWWG